MNQGLETTRACWPVRKPVPEQGLGQGGGRAEVPTVGQATCHEVLWLRERKQVGGRDPGHGERGTPSTCSHMTSVEGIRAITRLTC